MLGSGSGQMDGTGSAEPDQRATGQVEIEALPEQRASDEYHGMARLVALDDVGQMLDKNAALARHDLVPLRPAGQGTSKLGNRGFHRRGAFALPPVGNGRPQVAQ